MGKLELLTLTNPATRMTPLPFLDVGSVITNMPQRKARARNVEAFGSFARSSAESLGATRQRARAASGRAPFTSQSLDRPLASASSSRARSAHPRAASPSKSQGKRVSHVGDAAAPTKADASEVFTRASDLVAHGLIDVQASLDLDDIPRYELATHCNRWMPKDFGHPPPLPADYDPGNRWAMIAKGSLGSSNQDDDTPRGLHKDDSLMPKKPDVDPSGRYFKSRGAAPPAGPEEYAEPRLPIAARERDLGCMHHHVAAYGAQPGSVERGRHLCADDTEADMMRSRLDRLRQRREDARREKYIADVQKVLKGASKIRGGLEGPNRPAVLPPWPVSASNPPKREPEPKGGKGGKKGKKGKKARAKSATVFSRKEVDLSVEPQTISEMVSQHHRSIELSREEHPHVAYALGKLDPKPIVPTPPLVDCSTLPVQKKDVPDPGREANLVNLLYRHIQGHIMNLSHITLDLETAQVLKICLAREPHINELKLRNSSPTVDALDELAPQLRTDARLTKIDLSYCDIKGRGVRSLMPILRQRGGDYEPVRRAGQMRPMKLREICLSHNPLGVEGAKLLAQALPDNKHITKLDVSHCHLGEAGCIQLLQALEHHETLEWLSISTNTLGPHEGARALAATLLSHNGVTYLDVSGCCLRDQGMDVVADALSHKESPLVELDASDNQLYRAEALARLVKSTETLERLRIRNNPLDHANAAVFLRSFKANPHVSMVDLAACDLSKQQVEPSLNLKNPDGFYILDLGKLIHREIAKQLLTLSKKSGPRCFQHCRFNSLKFVMTEEWAKPEMVPRSGVLEFDFVLYPMGGAVPAPAAPVLSEEDKAFTPRKEALSENEFASLWTEVVARDTPVEWLFKYMDLVCENLYFTCSQVGRIVKGLMMPKWKVEQAVKLFNRVLDPINVHEFKSAFEADLWDQVVENFDLYTNANATNPTGSYTLDLEVPVEFLLAVQLRDQYLQQHQQRACDGRVRCCIRNLRLNYEPVLDMVVEVPASKLVTWTVPSEGILTMDFVTFRQPSHETTPLPTEVVYHMVSLFPTLHQFRKSNSDTMREAQLEIRRACAAAAANETTMKQEEAKRNTTHGPANQNPAIHERVDRVASEPHASSGRETVRSPSLMNSEANSRVPSRAGQVSTPPLGNQHEMSYDSAALDGVDAVGGGDEPLRRDGEEDVRAEKSFESTSRRSDKSVGSGEVHEDIGDEHSEPARSGVPGTKPTGGAGEEEDAPPRCVQLMRLLLQAWEPVTDSWDKLDPTWGVGPLTQPGSQAPSGPGENRRASSAIKRGKSAKGSKMGTNKVPSSLSKMQLKPELVAKAKQELIGKVEELVLLRPSDRYRMMRVLEHVDEEALAGMQGDVKDRMRYLVAKQEIQEVLFGEPWYQECTSCTLPAGSTVQCDVFFYGRVGLVVEGAGSLIGHVRLEDGGHKPDLQQMPIGPRSLVEELSAVLEGPEEMLPQPQLSLHAKERMTFVLIPQCYFRTAAKTMLLASKTIKHAARSMWMPETEPEDPEAVKPAQVAPGQSAHSATWNMHASVSTNLIRTLSRKHTFTCTQAMSVVLSKVFKTSLERVDAMLALYGTLSDKRNLSHLLQVLSAKEQVMLGERLGYINLFQIDHPQMHYKLNLGQMDDLHVARVLVRMATRGCGPRNLAGLRINNQGPVEFEEDARFMDNLSHPTAFLQFVRPTSPKARRRRRSNAVSRSKNGAKGAKPNVLEFTFEMRAEQRLMWGAVSVQNSWRCYRLNIELLKMRWLCLKAQIVYRARLFRMLCKQTWYSKGDTVRAVCDPGHVPGWRPTHRIRCNAVALLDFTARIAKRQKEAFGRQVPNSVTLAHIVADSKRIDKKVQGQKDNSVYKSITAIVKARSVFPQHATPKASINPSPTMVQSKAFTTANR